MSSRLITALDTASLDQAVGWARLVAPHSALLKIGLEFFLSHGPAGVAAINQRPVFLDLKLHDIPNTVAGAVRSVLPLGPAMLTLHASGGGAMIRAAREAADGGKNPPLLLAVTVLTSFDAAGLASVGMLGTPLAQVLRLAEVALAAGADGLVCSAHEVAALRAAFGPEPVLVVPGIRPAGAAVADQARTMTPAGAVEAGANFLVVGRPITTASDPGAAAQDIALQAA